ncbi:hypothetical protein [Luteibacter sp.]|uniref:hypothetical protein n=1 Tax=Luteibacter sp. TaxID=1886636 RepID=UPI003F7E8542
MGSSLAFFAGTEDYSSLLSKIDALGLHLLPLELGLPISDVETRPLCNLSLVALEDAHPYGDPRVIIGGAKDPMMDFFRPIYRAPYLVLGQVLWNDDDPAIAALTKPAFKGISKWVKSNWSKLPNGPFYIGPEAKHLYEHGAELVNILPDANATFTKVYY